MERSPQRREESEAVLRPWSECHCPQVPPQPADSGPDRTQATVHLELLSSWAPDHPVWLGIARRDL